MNKTLRKRPIDIAAQLAGNGYFPIPLAPGTKTPLHKGWHVVKDWRAQPWTDDCLVGVRMFDSGLFSIDVDLSSDIMCAAIRAQPEFSLSPLRRGQRGFALFGKWRDGQGRLGRDIRWIDLFENEHLIQLKAKGQMAVFGIHPKTGRPYAWDDDLDLLKVPLSALPVYDDVSDVLEPLDRVMGEFGCTRASRVRDNSQPYQPPGDGVLLLGELSDAEREGMRRKAGAAMRNLCRSLENRAEGTHRGREVYERMSALSPIVHDGVVTADELEEALQAVNTDWPSIARDFSNGLAKVVTLDANSAAVGMLADTRKEIEIERQKEAMAAGAPGFSYSENENSGANCPLAKAFFPDGRSSLEMARLAWNATRQKANIALTPKRDNRLLGKMIASIFCEANYGALFLRNEIIVAPRNATKLELISLDAEKMKVIVRECAQTWKHFKIEGGHEGGTLSADGREITVAKNKRGDELVLKTYKWMKENCLNFHEIPEYQQQDGWQSIEIHKDAYTYIEDEICRGLDGASLQHLRNNMGSPTFSSSGDIVAQDGYYESIHTLVTLGGVAPFVNITDNADVEQAKATVREFIALFPYADPASEAVLTSWFFSTLAQPSFDLAPVHIIEAPEPGIGKTFAVARIAEVGAGRKATVIGCGTSSDKREADSEVAKRVNAIAVTGGEGPVVLDDIPGGHMPNPQDFRTLTSSSAPVDIRVLGESRNVKVDPCAFLWSATGNNVVVSNDMVRRCVIGRLDRYPAEARGWSQEAAEARVSAILERPEERGPILAAALTILRVNWLRRPAQRSLHENFGSWSRMVREAVILTTGFDPVGTAERLKQEDPHAQELEDVVLAVLALSEGQPFKAGELMVLAMAEGSNPQNKNYMAGSTLCEKFEKAKTTRERLHWFGNYLKTYKGKWAGNNPSYRICRVGDDKHAKAAEWQIQKR